MGKKTIVINNVIRSMALSCDDEDCNNGGTSLHIPNSDKSVF